MNFSVKHYSGVYGEAWYISDADDQTGSWNSNYLWKDGTTHIANTGALGASNTMDAPGYWKTKEEAQAFLDAYNRREVPIVTDAAADKVLHAMQSLRSCIVTLKDGRAITLTYPVGMEPLFGVDDRGGYWWKDLKQAMQEISTTFFYRPSKCVESIKFDDEKEIKP